MARPRGGYVGHSVSPAASAVNSAASGVWTLREAEQLKRAGTWPTVFDAASISLLLHMDGANNSTTFPDSSTYAHSVTANSDAKVSTTQSKFGGASLVLDGNGDYLQLPASATFVFGAADFCIDFWSYVTGGDNQNVYDFRSGFSGLNASTAFNIGRSDANGHYVFNNVAGVILESGAGTASTNQWNHVAVTRSAGTLRLFVNGIVAASVANSTNFSNTQPPRIGSSAVSSGGDFFQGYIDEFRIVKGSAMFTEAFTPSSGAYENP